jgi:hypothetical protein
MPSSRVWRLAGWFVLGEDDGKTHSFQAGIRITYQSDTGRLACVPLSQRALNTVCKLGLMPRVLKGPFGLGTQNGQEKTRRW